ncbi:hypothetical protein ACFQVD_32125 [Streptosporangium amethystogenes subsp. fukuiense]|uniref:TetR family transcriptional regulator n=1 Tax=Streptosporangium amethystogenes subsp. fukuiense TaxID=698418 RepID=A0ABW2T7T1_9ACTN
MAADLAGHLDYVSAAGRPQDVACAIMALITEYAAIWVSQPPKTRLSPDAAIDLVTDLICTGITGPTP